MSSDTQILYPRRVRSFVRREGRLTPGQQRALNEIGESYVLPVTEQCMDLNSIFQREAPVILEIGFGMGHSLAIMAKSAPEKNFIGIEVHRPGIGSLLNLMQKDKITNIRIFMADAVDVLQKMIPDNSLTGVQIFFPDPWPKKRHHKRRLIQPAVVELIRQKLQINGFLHVATDWRDYAEHVLAVMSKAPDFTNIAGDAQYTSRGDRPLTKFEQRGQILGHGVWDLKFLRSR